MRRWRARLGEALEPREQLRRIRRRERDEGGHREARRIPVLPARDRRFDDSRKDPEDVGAVQIADAPPGRRQNHVLDHRLALEPVVRVGWTDPATDVDDDAAVLATGGVNLYLDERLKTQIQVDTLIPEEEGTDWAFRLHTVLEF